MCGLPAMRSVFILVTLCFFLEAQVARFPFHQGGMASNATDPYCFSSPLAVQNSYMTANWASAGVPSGPDSWYLCLMPSWATAVEPTPASGSPNYLQLTVWPAPGMRLWIDGLRFRTAAVLPPAVQSVAIYADEIPGPAGDNFSTRLATAATIFPNPRGASNVRVGLEHVAWLKNVGNPVTIRIYLWSGAFLGTNASEINELTVDGCGGVPAIASSLGPGCSHPLDGVLTADPPRLGTTCTIRMDSQFPGAMMFLYASLPPTVPIVSGWPTVCNVYVDLFNPLNHWLIGSYMLDSAGDWSWSIPIPSLPVLQGRSVILQGRICAPNGPVGPLTPDWLTNGLFLQIGCQN